MAGIPAARGRVRRDARDPVRNRGCPSGAESPSIPRSSQATRTVPGTACSSSSAKRAWQTASTGSDRWSLDHVFLNADGVPTLVEVKRSSDTRARREVVAQMLDYAANATAYWKVDALRAWFEPVSTVRRTRERVEFEVATIRSRSPRLNESAQRWKKVPPASGRHTR